jgi:hypothetical protein
LCFSFCATARAIDIGVVPVEFDNPSRSENYIPKLDMIQGACCRQFDVFGFAAVAAIQCEFVQFVTSPAFYAFHPYGEPWASLSGVGYV